ncbi:MAG: hypothetical protein OXI96_09085 [Acidimicrobiaceae bacterium]|nr:hypothetical protein [Acidimicrobiaceae bacterium]
MTRAVLDDHLLRDLLTDEASTALTRILAECDPATTNLYLVRLCRNVVSSRGGKLTGSWSANARRELGHSIVATNEDIEIVPMRALVFRMAELIDAHRLSSLGTEAVAASDRPPQAGNWHDTKTARQHQFRP